MEFREKLSKYARKIPQVETLTVWRRIDNPLELGRVNYALGFYHAPLSLSTGGKVGVQLFQTLFSRNERDITQQFTGRRQVEVMIASKLGR
jgi:hypothetical protein